MSCVGTTALQLSDLVPLGLPLSDDRALILSWDLAGLGTPESGDVLNSHFPFFWVNSVISAVGFLCVHRGM